MGITSINISVAENGYVVTCYESPERGNLFQEPCVHVGKTAADVTSMVRDFLKPGAEGCSEKEK